MLVQAGDYAAFIFQPLPLRHRRPTINQALPTTRRPAPAGLALRPSPATIPKTPIFAPESSYCWSTDINPSVMHEAPILSVRQAQAPNSLGFMLSVDSGAGQHVVPSPTSWGSHGACRACCRNAPHAFDMAMAPLRRALSCGKPEVKTRTNFAHRIDGRSPGCL